MYYIYAIQNVINDKFYVGRTENVKRRKGQHFSALRYNRHHCIKLQQAYNDEGEGNFTFTILHTTDTLQEALDIEQGYLDTVMETLYNVSPHAWEGGDVIKLHPYKNEIRKKTSEAISNYFKNLPEEDAKRIYGKSGELNNNYNGSTNLICPKCQGKKNHYALTCRKCQDTETTKRGVSREINVEGVVYKSVTDAANTLNISKSLLLYRIKSSKYNYSYV